MKPLQRPITTIQVPIGIREKLDRIAAHTGRRKYRQAEQIFEAGIVALGFLEASRQWPGQQS